ncbi:MAG: Atxe2 family lasso peptide isopeptidase [Sphingomonas sp.]|uniref:Atxe2 family lasso peptide isopeptidase n=1 Tax=Sphingomonas sp. TaxID=28214 RepID=UPI001B135AC0|nr:Atxe2 family lasso peptide isopeptidase [Sphingomonas sp.]MBO9623966.1 Atxe2 family lasso peptide isopeptidase [Sphingomonas sp.]
MHGLRAARLAGAAGFAALLLGMGAASATCADLLPDDSGTGARRPVTVEDLARLRDIGLPDASVLGWPSPLALSPDRRQIAFYLSRPDPQANRYCRGLVLLELRPGAQPRLLDLGGEPILSVGDYRGLRTETGFPQPVAPKWSPDGRWIAYPRRDGGITQVWLVPASGGTARPLTRSPVDIEQFAWRPDGQALVVTSRPATLVERAQIAREARIGFHYDARFVPNRGPTPQPRASTPIEYRVVQLAGDAGPTPATPADRSLIEPEGAAGIPPNPVAVAPGRRAWVERSATSPLSEPVLRVSGPWARQPDCARACIGRITGLWWLADGKTLLFLRREGWANGEMALYRWVPGDRAPRRILVTTDILDGCVLAQAELVCAREGATDPRHLVLIDPVSGASRRFFEANPEFARLRLGKVTRLFWRNDLGLEVRGDLVLPPGYRAHKRLPLIVTQYSSNGFLRGGTGDEYPIHAFAAAGFAVLSIERPAYFAAANSKVKSYEDVNAANVEGWGERKSLLSAVLAGVQLAIDRGIADPERVGITGLSDGAATVGFALVNTRRFAAAAISSCCLEPWTIMSVMGPAYADRMRSIGYPPATADDRRFWGPASLALNAAKIDTPLLMQLAEDEYVMALEAFTALREQGKPVDLFVFPAEHHIKWQPAHRLAVYRRNLAWFDFWLRDRQNADAAEPSEAAHWRALASRRPAKPRGVDARGSE